MPPDSVPLPIETPLSRKVTVPVGVPEPGPVTVAVNVTLWPNTDGLSDEASVVVDAPALMVWVKTAEVLPVKLLSPPYTAVIE